MNEFIKTALDKCGLVGYDGRLSLTTLAFIAIVVKVLTLPELDLAAIGALLVVILNYMHRRTKISEHTETPDAETGPIDAKLIQLTEAIKAVEQVAVEAKDKASKLALSAGFITKGRD